MTTAAASNGLSVDERVDRLEDLAEERWGDRWTISVERYADGDVSTLAYCSHGTVDREDVDGPVVEVERLQIDADGRVGYDHVHKRRDAVVAVLERETLDGGGDEATDA